MAQTPFVIVATFDGWFEAQGLRSALGRQWIEARVVVEGGWWQFMFGTDSTRFHIEVPENCYQEARGFLPRTQMSSF
jgi:hypothetical protein